MNDYYWRLIGKKVLTLPHSDVCHLEHGAKLQFRIFGSVGAGAKQAASVTFMVKVAEISCLQVNSRV